jgi:hypothetical protein
MQEAESLFRQSSIRGIPGMLAFPACRIGSAFLSGSVDCLQLFLDYNR